MRVDHPADGVQGGRQRHVAQRTLRVPRRRLPDAGPEVVVIDILRIDNGSVAEIWETIEPVVQAAANVRWWDGRPAPALSGSAAESP